MSFKKKNYNFNKIIQIFQMNIKKMLPLFKIFNNNKKNRDNNSIYIKIF